MSRDDILTNISANITNLRRSQGMTQAALAERLGYSDKSISKWERAEGVPDIVCLKNIADLFGVTVDYLLKKHDENEPISNEISDDTPASPYVVNHLAIVWLSIAAVWLLAAAAYVILRVCNVQLILPFAVALFVTSILLIIFNSLWGKRTFVFWTISLLVWSILFLICYIFKSYNPWLLMILGFPAMLVILLACRVKTRKKDE